MDEMQRVLDAFKEDSAKLLKEISDRRAEVDEQKAAVDKAKEEVQKEKDALEKAKGEALQEVEKIRQLHATLFTPATGSEKPMATMVTEAADAITKAKQRVDTLESSVTAYVELLLGKKGPDGKPLPSIKADLEEKAEQLKQLHSKIFDKPAEDRIPLAKEVDQFMEEFTKKKRELDGIKEEVVGYQDELLGKVVDGQRVDGVKGKVAGYVSDLNDLVVDSTATQEKLTKEAEKMLQAASTASLATASNEQKKSFDKVNYIWMGVFAAAIVFIMLSPFFKIPKVGEVELEWWKQALVKLPFMGGAIWLAVFASKQRSQNKRLQQEYAYKENVAKIYYALKKEIEDLEDAELATELKTKVMRVLVRSVGYNPSVTLESKSHDDRGPWLESLKPLAEKAPDLLDMLKNKGH